MTTARGLLKAPTSFFRPSRLMPVFPPTAASTMASSVVGKFTQAMPRLNVAAANPPRSVTMPPPRQTSSERRDAPPAERARHTSESEPSVLCSSPGAMESHVAPASDEASESRGRQRRPVVSSVSTKTRSGPMAATTRSVSAQMFSDRMISGFISRQKEGQKKKLRATERVSLKRKRPSMTVSLCNISSRPSLS